MSLTNEQKESLKKLMYKYCTAKVVSPEKDTFNASIELKKNTSDQKEVEMLLASASDDDFSDSFYGGILKSLKILVE